MGSFVLIFFKADADHDQKRGLHAPIHGQKIFQPPYPRFFHFYQDPLENHRGSQCVSDGRVPFLDFDTKVPGHRIQALIGPAHFCIRSQMRRKANLATNGFGIQNQILNGKTVILSHVDI